MCGIVALFLNRPLSPADVTMGDQATFDLRHRGPDASGEWVDRKSGIFFGHRRLTVIDLTDASSQPMVLGEHVVTYNGEIYNYRDLRERLRGLGHSFSTQGDTEVLMTAWRHFGPKALDSIEGMFAFALCDGRDGWLATDRFGEKQLFYATTPDGIAAASELPTLARMVGATQNISHEETAAFLSLGYIPGPGTVYPSIRRMPPATILRISGGKIIDQRRYWRPPFGEPGHGPVEPISENGLDRIQAVLVDSVSLRLEADAPSCLYLSSGTDSSLVAAISARSLGRKLDAITVRFSTGNAHDETADAQTIASEIGLPHHIVENQNEATAVNPEFFSNLIGQPTDDLTLASLHQMARAGAGRGFKVGLTGLGGDEVVFGYNKHAFIFEHRRVLNSPEWLRRWLGHVVGAIGGRTSKAQTYRETVKVRDFERYISVKNFPTIRALREVPGFDRWASRNFAPTRRRLEFEVPVFEFEGVMTGHRLPSTDAGSMRASMEFRTPFLSRALQETIAEFDPQALMKFGQKSVFRRLLKRYLPDQMVDLPKRGFVFPSDRFEWVGRDRAPPTKLAPRELVEEIWRNRSKPGWRALATRIAMLSEFENWVPGRLPQNPEQTKPAEPAASAAS